MRQFRSLSSAETGTFYILLLMHAADLNCKTEIHRKENAVPPIP